MRRLTHLAYIVLGLAGLFALTIWFGATHSGFAVFLMDVLDWLPLDRTVFLGQLEGAGVFFVGVGVGGMAWILTGRLAAIYLFRRVARAWTLWQRGVLTSSLPVFKYLLMGGLMIGLGAFLLRQLWGLWTGAYDAGLATGATMGALHSLAETPTNRTQIDFLEANQRYLDDQKVAVFTETEKP